MIDFCFFQINKQIKLFFPREREAKSILNVCFESRPRISVGVGRRQVLLRNVQNLGSDVLPVSDI